MENTKKLKKILCKEVDEIAEKGDMSAGDLEVLHKLTGTIKNLSTIEAMDGEGYSGNYSGNYSGGNYSGHYEDMDRSYGRSYGRYSGEEDGYSGRTYVRGHYRY